MRRFSAISTVALALTICASTWAGDADKEKAKLQGSWAMTKVMIRGDDKTDLFKGGITYTFAGDKLTAKIASEVHEGTFKVVDATKKPMHIDLSLPKQMDSKAIYEIDGNTLKIGVGEKGSSRPKGFDAKDIMVMTFKKMSK